MKKIFYMLIMVSLSFLFTFNVYAKDNEVVKVHVFYAEWCGNCQNLHKFLNELSEDKNYNKMFEIIYYRMDNDSKYGKNPDFDFNKKLYSKVKENYRDMDNGIPLYFIGDTYNIGFYPDTTPDKIKKLIKENYYSKEKNDVIEEIINNNIDEFNNKRELGKTKIIGIVVIVVTLVIAGVIFVIYLKNR